MNEPTSQIKSPWIYEGIWGILTSIFCVPREAPTLPIVESERIRARKPSPAFLQYLKFQLWVSMVFMFLVAAVSLVFLILALDNPWAILLVVPTVIILVIPLVVGYLTIHLRYDTTWYVFSDRSMRLRRGVWVINEATITFANIQNVKVTQGPLERYFGIANVVVETAGGGGASTASGTSNSMHTGLIEGVAEAAQIRDAIMNHVRRNESTGLGDDHESVPNLQSAWSAQHLSILREIRDLSNKACG